MPTPVGQLWMVSHVDEVKHDGTRAEVKRDVRADHVTGVALYFEIREASLLDPAHADHGLWPTTGDDHRIREKAADFDNRRQVVDVSDMKDRTLFIGRRGDVVRLLVEWLTATVR